MVISTVDHKKENPCGLSMFSDKLTEVFKQLGVISIEHNFNRSNIVDNHCTIFHYVPSLYANNNEFFDVNLKVCNNLITIIHGIYPKDKFNYLGDTVNNFQKTQLEIIGKYSKALIFLSSSALRLYKDWSNNQNENNFFLLRHPGLKIEDLKLEPNQNDYVFTGGVTRKKKSYESQIEKQLLQSLNEKGVKVWLHSTNNHILPEIRNLVWKYTSGKLETKQWNKILYQSRMILCPYSTEIQTVSGIISEGVSCGKQIVSTSFPYALEISQEYNEYIIVEDDIKKWPNIVRENWDKNNLIPEFIDWKFFGESIINMVKNVC